MQVNSFSTPDATGMRVSLEALPATEEDRLRDDAGAFADDCDDITLHAQRLPWLPQWWALSPGCTHESCACEALDLVMALQRLPMKDRPRAVEAHLEALQVLSQHYGAALSTHDGNVESEVCVGCVADLDEHLETLEMHLASMGRSLGDALSLGLVHLTAS